MNNQYIQFVDNYSSCGWICARLPLAVNTDHLILVHIHVISNIINVSETIWGLESRSLIHLVIILYTSFKS